MLKIKEL